MKRSPWWATYCATKVPSEHDDKIRIEYKVRGNTITIYECRPPWREDRGPDWTAMRICSMEWDPATRLWTLYSRDRNDRRLDYPFIDPSRSVRIPQHYQGSLSNATSTLSPHRCCSPSSNEPSPT